MPTEQPGQPIYSSEKPHIQFDKDINCDKAQTNSHNLSKFNSKPCTNGNEKVTDWIILPTQLPKDPIDHIDMLETRCRETLQRLSSEPLLTEQWEICFNNHNGLLRAYYEYLIAIPPTSLQARFNMMRRMWFYGVFHFVEELKRLPNAERHIQRFTLFAFSTFTQLFHKAHDLEQQLAEYLGNITQTAFIHERNVADKRYWKEQSQDWYTTAARLNPGSGQILYNLGTLPCIDDLQKLFYLSKCLLSTEPLVDVCDSIKSLLTPLLCSAPADGYPLFLSCFLNAHGILLTRQRIARYVMKAEDALCLLDKHIERTGKEFETEGVYICCLNFAAVFTFGQSKAPIPRRLRPWVQDSAQKFWEENHSLEQTAITLRGPVDSGRMFRHTDEVITFSSHLTFSMLRIIIKCQIDRNILPAIHTSLAYLWSLVLVPQSMMYIQADVPWADIVDFLNTQISEETDIPKMKDEQLIIYKDQSGRPLLLPEDFLIGGYAWSNLYYLDDFFQTRDKPGERPEFMIHRIYRCLWLGYKIARGERWITYDNEKRAFSVTDFALMLETMAKCHIPSTSSMTDMQ